MLAHSNLLYYHMAHLPQFSKIFIEEHTWDITFMDLNGFCKFYDDWSFPCLLWIWKATLAMDNIFAKNDIRFFTFNLSKQFDKAQWKP